jgi:hypothetical protein
LTIAVLLVLGVAWAVFLVPKILRDRGQQGRTDSVGDFHYRLSTLGHANGTHQARSRGVSPQHPMFGPSAGSAQMSAAQKRRRDVLFVLVGIAAATLFLAALTRMMPLFALQLVADVVLGGYIYLLIQHKHRMREQQAKVRYLGAPHGAAEPYFPKQYPLYPSRGRSGSNVPRLVPFRQTASN